MNKWLYKFMEKPDISDRLGPNLNLSGLSGRPWGPPKQAERIAYLDAFMSVLATLPYEDIGEEWLSHRICAAKAWLQNQGYRFQNNVQVRTDKLTGLTNLSTMSEICQFLL